MPLLLRLSACHLTYYYYCLLVICTISPSWCRVAAEALAQAASSPAAQSILCPDARLVLHTRLTSQMAIEARQEQGVAQQSHYLCLPRPTDWADRRRTCRQPHACHGGNPVVREVSRR